MNLKLYEDKNAPVNKRVDDLLGRMTLEEKVAQLGSVGPDVLLNDKGEFCPEKAKKVIPEGIGQITRIAGASGLEPTKAAKAANDIQYFLEHHTRLKIPALLHEECLSGLMTKGGTAYPQSIGMACTWNPQLIKAMTEEIRKQMLAIGARLGLSPVVDLARDLRWGRVEETFGEDPYLTASMAVAYIQGLQGIEPEKSVLGTLKHFAGHGFSEGGRNHASVNIAPRDFREQCLFPYEAAIKEAQVKAIMSSYHDIDGIPCAASKSLLTDILRGELGFNGMVVSDYNNIKMLHTEHRIAETMQQAGILALEAGLDIELPKTDCYGELLVEAVKSGLISIDTVEQAVKRHLEIKFMLGLFENRYIETDNVISVFETKEQRQLARQIGRESIVLLKNENNLLPLDKNKIKSIALIGPSADSTRNVLGDYVYSAHVDSPEDAVPVVSILDGVKAKLGENVKVNYAEGCGIMNYSTDGFEEAIEAAKQSDIAVVVVGGRSGLSGLVNPGDISDVDFTNRGYIKDTDGESHDRTSLDLTGVQEQLVQAIYQTKTPTIVVLINGRPLTINWIAEHIPAIVEAWLPGAEAGNAVVDVLFGDYNPDGKLCVSIPKTVGQMPVHYNRTNISYNRQYIYVDNRPLYPFGYGLSYTEFAYRNLTVTPKQTEAPAEIQVEFEVGNVGETAGAEVAQLYIRDLYASRNRPVKELKGYAKVWLEPQEWKRVRFVLSTDQLAFYDQSMELVVEPGTFSLMIGSSSQDIRLKEELELTGEIQKVGPNRCYFAQVEIEE
ncbi:MAG: beta-glucosidase [Firmicutes bacterium]|nr:beta-glucosidase [Bacillota bacterium]